MRSYQFIERSRFIIRTTRGDHIYVSTVYVRYVSTFKCEPALERSRLLRVAEYFTRMHCFVIALFAKYVLTIQRLRFNDFEDDNKKVPFARYDEKFFFNTLHKSLTIHDIISIFRKYIYLCIFVIFSIYPRNCDYIIRVIR